VVGAAVGVAISMSPTTRLLSGVTGHATVVAQHRTECPDDAKAHVGVKVVAKDDPPTTVAPFWPLMLHTFDDQINSSSMPQLVPRTASA
jgi:hypothetical protein